MSRSIFPPVKKNYVDFLFQFDAFETVMLWLGLLFAFGSIGLFIIVAVAQVRMRIRIYILFNMQTLAPKRERGDWMFLYIVPENIGASIEACFYESA